jgi:hypothetical protein
LFFLAGAEFSVCAAARPRVKRRMTAGTETVRRREGGGVGFLAVTLNSLEPVVFVFVFPFIFAIIAVLRTCG